MFTCSALQSEAGRFYPSSGVFHIQLRFVCQCALLTVAVRRWEAATLALATHYFPITPARYTRPELLCWHV